MRRNNAFSLWSVLAIFIVLLTTGCEDPNGGVTGPSVTEVTDVDLTRTVTAGTDFGSGGGLANTIPTDITLDELLDDLDAIITVLEDEFDGNSDFENYDPDADGAVTFTPTPSNLLELTELPDTFSVLVSATNAHPSSGWTVNGDAEFSLTMPTDDDGYPARITGSLELVGLDIDVPAINADDYSDGADIHAARILAEVNAAIDVIPVYSTDDFGETSPVGGEAAYSIAVEAQAAVSYDNSMNGGYQGNIVITLSYTESQYLNVTEQMINDGTVDEYLDGQLEPAEFSVTVEAYEQNATTPFETWTYSLGDLTGIADDVAM